MNNAEKSRSWAITAALDRIAIPLILAGASPAEAYKEALRRCPRGEVKDAPQPQGATPAQRQYAASGSGSKAQTQNRPHWRSG